MLTANVFILLSNLWKKMSFQYSLPITLIEYFSSEMLKCQFHLLKDCMITALSSKRTWRETVKVWEHILTKFTFPVYFEVSNCFYLFLKFFWGGVLVWRILFCIFVQTLLIPDLILIFHAQCKISNQRRNISFLFLLFVYPHRLTDFVSSTSLHCSI